MTVYYYTNVNSRLFFWLGGYEAVSVSQIAGELDMPQEDKTARFYSVMFFYYKS